MIDSFIEKHTYYCMGVKQIEYKRLCEDIIKECASIARYSSDSSEALIAAENILDHFNLNREENVRDGKSSHYGYRSAGGVETN